MLQVKMPKAYKILPEPAVLQWGDETTNVAVAQSNAEDETNSMAFCELALESTREMKPVVLLPQVYQKY